MGGVRAMTSRSKEMLRDLAERVLKHRGLASAVEATQLARAVLMMTGGIR